MTSDKSIATLRFKWNSSIIKVTVTSISDIEEVSAAINKVKKNTMAIMEPPGIWQNISGNMMNTRPGPSLGDMLKAKTAGIMAIPAIKAKTVSEMAVSDDVLSILSFFFTYDEYVSIVPQPILKEKNACPRAFINVSPVIFEKSGLKRKEIPSDAPGNVTERIAIIIIIKNNTGIIIFENFSIPFLIPPSITPPVSSKNINMYIRGSHEDVTILLNMFVADSPSI